MPYKLVIALALLAGIITSPAEARHRHHHSRVVASYSEQIVGHPAGCPHSQFCGCAASVRLFGHPVRELYLAANWLRFPAASPAPGMAAARHGHVFIIEQVNGDGTVEAYDPNSGGHQTRIHTVSLAGYRVVNPHGSEYGTAAVHHKAGARHVAAGVGNQEGNGSLHFFQPGQALHGDLGDPLPDINSARAQAVYTDFTAPHGRKVSRHSHYASLNH